MRASGGIRANSLHCVSLKQRAALICLKLCSSARLEGKGSPVALRAIAALGPGRRDERGAGIGGAVPLSDHDFAQRNSCSDTNPGTAGATRVLCEFMLPAVHYRRDDERLLSAMSCRWRYQDAGTQRKGNRHVAVRGRTVHAFQWRRAAPCRNVSELTVLLGRASAISLIRLLFTFCGPLRQGGRILQVVGQ